MKRSLSRGRLLPSLVAIVGPTASGKTDIALALAKRFQGEIIIADSRQVYRGMDIGTNKIMAGPSREIQPLRVKDRPPIIVGGIPYHGIDLVEPSTAFTVQDWKQYALQTAREITARGHLPILEGGTGLYFWALLDNLTLPKVPPDAALREKLERRIAQEGLEVLVAELLERDPEASLFLDAHNPRRVIRALEIVEKTGVPFSQQRAKGEGLFADLRIGVARPLEKIDQRIAARVDEQLRRGLEDEVRGLAERYGWEISAMTGIGYREWKDYFSGETDRAEVARRIIQNTQRYARAQLKWFRRDPAIRWIDSPGEIEKVVSHFLEIRRGAS